MRSFVWDRISIYTYIHMLPYDVCQTLCRSRDLCRLSDGLCIISYYGGKCFYFYYYYYGYYLPVRNERAGPDVVLRRPDILTKYLYLEHCTKPARKNIITMRIMSELHPDIW